MAKFAKSDAKIEKGLPLRWVLTLPVVLQICAFIGITGWLSLVNSQTAVNEIVNQLQKEISDRVEERTKTYTEIPYLFLRIQSTAVKTGELNLEDFPRFQRYLWEQVQLYEAVPFIYYANENGEFLGVEKKEDGTGVLWILDKPKIPTLTFYRLDEQGNRTGFIESKEYDPRLRPWYQAAIKNSNNQTGERIGTPVWSPIYADIRRPILVASLMIPIYTETGNIQGVLATDLSLVSLSKFLQNLEISKSGQGETFIIDKLGNLVASSAKELPFEVTADGLTQVKAINSRNLLIRETAKYLQKDFANLDNLNKDNFSEITISQERHFLEINSTKIQGGLELIIVVVQPESDFLAYINENNKRTILLFILALVAAIGLGFFTTRWITQPIRSLSKASQEIANGKLNQKIRVGRIKELAILAQSFNQMLEQLRESFTVLKKTNKELEHRVQERTRSLRVSEEKFSTAFRSTPHAVTIKGLKDKKYREVNDSFLNLTGYILDEVINSTAEILNLWQDLVDREKIYHTLETEGLVRNYELKIKTKSGALKTVLLSAEIIEIDGEKNILTVTNDITETKQAQKDLRKERILLRGLIDSIPDIIFYMNENGVYLACNQAFETYVGKTREEIIGKTDLDLFPQELVQTSRAHCAKMLSLRETCQYGEVLQYPDGSLCAVDTLISPLLNETGKLIGIIGVSRDISQRKRAEEELQQAKESAEQAAQAKSQFLATMSHEIRTPINGVLGMTQLLAATKLTPEQHKYVQTIDISGNTLLTVINDILDFSKIESGKFEIEQRPLDIRACIENVYDVLATTAHAKNIDLLYLVEPEVPTYIIGDETRINQMLMNLVNNGIKFTEKGEVCIRVSQKKIERINTNKGKDIELNICVSDTGIGINEEQRSRLFKPFSQVDASTTRKYGGTGLGLAICSRLVKLMGGKIWVESIIGQGSNFFFTIQTKAAPAQSKRYLTKQIPEIKNKRVLLVDDNQTNLEILIWQCQQWQMLPFATARGKEAISWIKRGDPFDIAILDMAMPEMDGITLGCELRKLKSKKELPLILLTSLGKHNEDAELINQNFSAYISKPVKQSTLFNTIVNVFANVKQSYQQKSAKQIKIDDKLAQNLPLKILLAEDNLINQEFATAILKKMGYKIDVVNNGRDAIVACKKRKYDIVFMDVQMPEIDGLEATREIIKRLPPETRPKIIAMTANVMKDDRDQCLQAGMDDYISKPVKIQLIQQMLEKWGKPQTNTATNTSTSARQILDQNAMIISLAATKPELVKKMTHLYLDQEGPRRLAEIKQAIAEGNAKGLKYSAHTFKGGSATLGAVGVVEVCQQLEARAKNQDFADIDRLVQKLEQRYQEARQKLVKFL